MAENAVAPEPPLVHEERANDAALAVEAPDDAPAQPARASDATADAEYATFFQPRTHKFDTVDFRVPSSKVNLAKYFPKSAKERQRSNLAAAMMGVLVGVAIGIVGFCVDQLVRGVTMAIYIPTDALLSRRTGLSYFGAVVVYAFLSCVAVLVSCLLVLLVAPLGAGSGIPELKAYLNGVHVPGYLRFRTLLVKFVGVAFTIGGGLICGKQGPMIHAGAIIGAGMSQGASAQFGVRLGRPFSKTLRFLRTNAWKRDFTAVGAAIGVAVAFGAPMGGWVWVYEEACTHWTWALGLITLGGCMSGVITVGFLNFLAAGMPSGGFGRFTLTDFGKLYSAPSSRMLFPLADIPMYIAIGLLGGLVGAVLPLVNKHITLFRYKRVTLRANRIVEALLIGFLTAFLRIVIPKIANDCAPVNVSFVNSLRGDFDYSSFNCPDGQFSLWAATLYNPTSAIVRSLLFAEDAKVFNAPPLVIAFIVFYIFIVWTYGVAVPAGVFFPGFLIGTVYGRLCAVLVESVFPNRFDMSMSAYAFLGAVSALAGITRTISVAIIAIEATAKGEAFFGSIIVAVTAKIVADKLYALGIYDLHIALKGMPFLTETVPKLASYNMVRVRDVMEKNVVGVRRHSKVIEILHVLRTTQHHSFPVFLKLVNRRRQGIVLDSDSSSSRGGSFDTKEVPASRFSSIITPTPHGMIGARFTDGAVRMTQLRDHGKVEVVEAHNKAGALVADNSPMAPTGDEEIQDFGVTGMITRDVLLAVLQKLVDLGDDDVVNRNQLDSAWPNSERGKNEDELLDKVRKSELLDIVVDLDPYIDPDPLLISGRALSTTAYRLLRTTGARHMLVTNMSIGRVVGIVTRKDILPESIDAVLNTLTETKVA